MSASPATPHELVARIARVVDGGISLREERADDVPFLRDLYASVRAAELAPVPWSAADKRHFLDSQFDLQRDYYRANYAGAAFCAIERDGAPIGRFYLHRAGHELRLMDIALVETVRGQGIGGALLRALLAVADAERCSVTLHVEHDNRALALYDRLGFALIEDRGVNRFLGRPPRALS